MKFSDKDTRYMQYALSLARMSECNTRTRHGCLIVKSGHVIAVGINQYRNDPTLFNFTLTDTKGISVHAEEACLRSVRHQAKNCTAYIARVNSSDKQALSRPCSRCMHQLKQAGVNKIIYTVSNGIRIERI